MATQLHGHLNGAAPTEAAAAALEATLLGEVTGRASATLNSADPGAQDREERPATGSDLAGNAPAQRVPGDGAPTAVGAPAAVGPPAGEDGAVGLAVRTRGLRRTFGDHVVLDGIDLDIAAGQFVALLGRSGSGKSTLLRILGGFDTGIAGDVLAATRRSVVFQEARLLPWTRALGNVTLGLSGKDVAARGRAALAEVGLAGREQAWPVTLSGGEAQRVALARALVREPDLVMLDEPFGALDALTRIRMHALLQELCRRHRPAVLFVTHDVDEAILLADRVLVLTEGRLSLDLPVGLPSPRPRGDPAFGALRARLLHELGVDEKAG